MEALGEALGVAVVGEGTANMRGNLSMGDTPDIDKKVGNRDSCCERVKGEAMVVNPNTVRDIA